jgi:hypothetical protein
MIRSGCKSCSTRLSRYLLLKFPLPTAVTIVATIQCLEFHWRYKTDSLKMIFIKKTNKKTIPRETQIQENDYTHEK